MLIKLKNKVKFLVDETISRFYYSNRYFYQQYIRDKYKKSSKEFIRKFHPDLFLLINKMLSKMEFESFHKYTFWGDAYFLLNYLKNNKPVKILELGSGVSTLVFAYFLHKSKEENSLSSKAELVTLDENKDYQRNLVAKSIPIEMRNNIVFLYSSLEIKKYEKGNFFANGIYYSNTPKQHFELIYVDGPQVVPGVYNDSSYISEHPLTKIKIKPKPFDSDILNLSNNLSRDTKIIIDQRIDTVWKIKKFLSGYIEKKYYFSAKKTLIELKSQIHETII